jgi:Domain of unknown function (DUF4062)
MPKKKAKLTVFISSSVYGREPLLEQVFAWIEGLGYEAWNSYMGTLPIGLRTGNYESCIKAAEMCDIFFGLITPRYGSGTDGVGGPAITQLEFEKAIELGKPRLVLAHEQVVNARRLLMDLGFKGHDGRKSLVLKKGAEIIDDLRLLDIYEAATQEDLPVPQRDNHWVQKYRTDSDVARYIERQFSRYSDMERAVVEWRVQQEAPK